MQARYGITLQIGRSGISAMMHGYLAFDRDGTLLVPFRTWRNTCTGPAAEKLSEVLDFVMCPFGGPPPTCSRRCSTARNM